MSLLSSDDCQQSLLFGGLWQQKSNLCLCLHMTIFLPCSYARVGHDSTTKPPPPPHSCCGEASGFLSHQEDSCGSEVKSLSRVRLFVTPWTVAYQAPQSTEFSRQEYWSGLSFPSGDLPNQGIEPWSPALPADALPSEPPGKPQLR